LQADEDGFHGPPRLHLEDDSADVRARILATDEIKFRIVLRVQVVWDHQPDHVTRPQPQVV